jgi:hypothetical protein
MSQRPIRSGAATSLTSGLRANGVTLAAVLDFLRAQDSGLDIVGKAGRRAGYQGTGHGL